MTQYDIESRLQELDQMPEFTPAQQAEYDTLESLWHEIQGA